MFSGVIVDPTFERDGEYLTHNSTTFAVAESAPLPMTSQVGNLPIEPTVVRKREYGHVRFYGNYGLWLPKNVQPEISFERLLSVYSDAVKGKK